MKKATLVVSKPYLNNRIFNRNDYTLNRDDCLAPFLFLKNEFKRFNIDLSTQDINPIKTSDYIIFNDMPEVLPDKCDSSRSFLLILESPIIVKNSWKQERLSRFKKVFTWNDDYIDNKSFIKINYSYDFQKQGFLYGKKKKLLCMISANKTSKETNELYSEREKIIRWYENNYPSDFDLYGIGWDKIRLNGIWRAIKKVPFIWEKIPFKGYPSYKGAVAQKKEIMSNYKFSLCFENIKDLNGYITEKIFDSFFSGTIPIYHGAKNIHKYIPKECFIDRRAFSSQQELHDFISNMDEITYNRYLENIKLFLDREVNGVFSCSHFAKTVTNNILKS